MKLNKLLILWPPFEIRHAPSIPGVELYAGWERPHYHVAENRPQFGVLSTRPHFTTPGTRPHFTTPEPRPHYFVPEEP